MANQGSSAGVQIAARALSISSLFLAVAGVAQVAEPDDPDWQHPVTSWGDPDLQGMWPVQHMTLTPLERPPEFGTRSVLNDQEFAQRTAQIDERNTAYDGEISENQMGMGHWREAGQVPQRQASLIVDPADGRLPALTAAGRAKSATMKSSWQSIPFDSYTDFDSWDRCITRGLPPSMHPMQYNNGIQILQSPGYVVIRLEMIHETRIVPINGMPQLDAGIRQWMGESRGHWEGNTLVVETTNFNGLTPATNVVTPGAPQGNNIPTSENMRVVERFTRIDDDTINFSITAHDPQMLEDSWTVAYPMQLDPGYRFFEYACHEDNYAVRYYIETSRYERGVK